MIEPASFAATIAERHSRRERYTLEVPPGRSGDLAFAYDVQDALLPLLTGGPPRAVAYKIGLTTPRMQQMCGIDEPIVGAVLAGRLAFSAARVAVADHVHVGVESEIALRIGPTVPPGDVTDASVLEHVDAVAAAFELVDDRGADYARLAAVTLVADNGWNAGLIIGPPSAPGGPGSLKGLKGVLRCDGQVVDEGTSSDVLGDPAAALAWVVRHLARRGKSLSPGQWVSTGSIVPTKFVEPGQTWRFEVDGLAAVDVSVD